MLLQSLVPKTSLFLSTLAITSLHTTVAFLNLLILSHAVFVVGSNPVITRAVWRNTFKCSHLVPFSPDSVCKMLISGLLVSSCSFVSFFLVSPPTFCLWVFWGFFLFCFVFAFLYKG